MDTLSHKIDCYEIVKQIGRGGMAVVYQAKDPDQNIVAIKVLQPKYENISEFRKRFRREAQALAKLDNSHILSIHDYRDLGETNLGEGPRAYLVTCYLPGGCLKDKLQDQQPLPTEQACLIITQLLNALDYAHGKKLIHRDITPGNILFKEDGNLVLSDFGLVKFLEENPGSDHGLTQAGQVMGTPRYMAPELLQGQPATQQSDLYSVGVILYQMLTGTYPFESEPLKFTNLPRPIRETNPTVPAQLEEIVLKVLDKDPQQRYQSAAEMRDALQAISFDPTVQAQTTPATIQSPRVENDLPRKIGSSSLNLPPNFPQPTSQSHRKKPLGFLAILITVILTTVIVLEIPAIVTRLRSPSPPPPSSVIKIGVDLPLTEGNASSGLPIAGGVQFAIDQANKQNFLPGYTFEEYTSPNQPVLDDQSDPSIGAVNVSNAISDALTAAIIGPYNSAVAENEIPITNRAPIAQISPANTNPCLTKDTPETDCTGGNDLLPKLRPTGMTTYFRLPATDDLLVKAFVPFLRARSYRTAYVIYNRDDLYSKFFSKLFVEAWQNDSGTLVAPIDDESPDSDVSQYEAQFKLLPTNPDLIFYAGTMPAAAKVKQAMDNIPQLNKTAFAGGAGIMLNQFAQAIGSGGGPVFASVPVGNTPATQGFQTDYLSGQDGQDGYTPYTASAYDCTLIVMQAIKTVMQQKHILPPTSSGNIPEAKKFRQAIITEISNLNANTITGNLTFTTNFQSFDRSGDNTNNYVSIYSLSGNTIWPWQLLKSDPVTI